MKRKPTQKPQQREAPLTAEPTPQAVVELITLIQSKTHEPANWADPQARLLRAVKTRLLWLEEQLSLYERLYKEGESKYPGRQQNKIIADISATTGIKRSMVFHWLKLLRKLGRIPPRNRPRQNTKNQPQAPSKPNIALPAADSIKFLAFPKNVPDLTALLNRAVLARIGGQESLELMHKHLIEGMSLRALAAEHGGSDSALGMRLAIVKRRLAEAGLTIEPDNGQLVLGMVANFQTTKREA